MASISPRPIKKLLVANRGEIAARILSSARELDLTTYAIYTESDIGHTYHAHHAIRLESPSAYMDIDALAEIVRRHDIDAVHPGYGFLSESSSFAARLAELGVLCIGPGANILSHTGDKLAARRLATDCGVPVLPAFTTPTDDLAQIRHFAHQHGYPIMVKAVDGGGGRGIRLIRAPDQLHSAVTRAIEESPSKQVFAEKAAVDGFRHVEVQVIGDSQGNVRHLWERECSIQRRYQKVVEFAPTISMSRAVVVPVIQAAITIAEKIRYASLGTFEFLVNPHNADFYFLEVNPRLQVEHTITESICSIDIVRLQLQLAQGLSFAETGLLEIPQDPMIPPPRHSIQLRVTAENPQKNYALSVGRIQSFTFPSGPGIRVDTALISGAPAVITSDFDSLIAKIIVTARTWRETVSKAQRALADTHIIGVHTNVSMLRAIVASSDFRDGRCDTQWLESKHEDLIDRSLALEGSSSPYHRLAAASTSASSAPSTAATNSSILFRKDDAWTIDLHTAGNPEEPSSRESEQASKNHLQITRVLRNDFPDLFAADVLYTTPGAKPKAFTAQIKSTSASGTAATSQHRQGSRNDPTHIVMPLSGKLIEFLVDVGDVVEKDQPICVIRQMKMEVEVRTHRSGQVSWVTEADDDEDIAEGMLAAVIVDDKTQAKL